MVMVGNANFLCDHPKNTYTKQKGDYTALICIYGGTVVVESTTYEIVIGGGGFEWGQWWSTRVVLRNPDRLERDRKELFLGICPEVIKLT